RRDSAAADRRGAWPGGAARFPAIACSSTASRLDSFSMTALGLHRHAIWAKLSEKNEPQSILRQSGDKGKTRRLFHTRRFFSAGHVRIQIPTYWPVNFRSPHYNNADAATFEIRARNRPSSPCGCVVKRIQNASASGSSQHNVPVAPQCP